MIELELDYSFLAGISDRGATMRRRDLAYRVFDKFCEALALQAVTRAGVATTAPINFIIVRSMDYADTPETSAMLMRFTVGIRNWQVNSPA